MKRFLDNLSSPAVFFYTAIWLLILLVVGTIEQKYIGLYLAQNKYFSSWFFDWNFLPLPGGRLAMTVMFFNLLAKLVWASPIRWDRAGTLISHSGGLLLLLGGFFTAYFSKEGSMLLFEGEKWGAFSDYHELELAVIDTSNPEFDEVTAFRNDLLAPGLVLADEKVPGKIRILEYHRNAAVVNREGPVPANYQGMLKRFALAPQNLETEFERNQAGIVFELEGFGAEDGVYGLIQHMRVPQLVQAGSKTFRLELRNQKYQLPFEIELIDFQKIVYPGTTKAKEFRSIVNVVEDGVSRRVVISMNQPLRNHEYTFYQASFIESEQEASVLAVVRNAGRNYPYIASIVMSFGLFIHIVLRLPKLVRRVS